MALPNPAPRFDRPDYFAWETDQPIKHEYVAGEVFAQAGARQNHVVVAGSCFAALRQRQRLRGAPWFEDVAHANAEKTSVTASADNPSGTSPSR